MPNGLNIPTIIAKQRIPARGRKCFRIEGAFRRGRAAQRGEHLPSKLVGSGAGQGVNSLQGLRQAKMVSRFLPSWQFERPSKLAEICEQNLAIRPPLNCRSAAIAALARGGERARKPLFEETLLGCRLLRRPEVVKDDGVGGFGVADVGKVLAIGRPMATKQILVLANIGDLAGL